MADIQSIDMKNGKILVNLRLTKEEYNLLGQLTEQLLLLPAGPNISNVFLSNQHSHNFLDSKKDYKKIRGPIYPRKNIFDWVE